MINEDISSLSSDESLDSPIVKKANCNKPKCSKFTQQDLPACKLLLTPTIVISSLAAIGIIFISIGLASLLESNRVIEIVDRYDADCIPVNDKISFIKNDQKNKTCTRTLIVPRHMKSPIYVYYQLDNFYQNHRRYVKSRSDKQLLGKEPNDKNATSMCEPEANTPNGDPIVPCGLIAWSLFNDTYKFYVNGKNLDVNRNNIAWASDKKHKFSSQVYPENFQTGGLVGGASLNASIPLSEQEDLMVWMRTAALPTFRKIYGKIEEDLESDEKITVVIQNQYNTYSIKGKKSLVLSTSSWLGGKNEFLAVSYLTVGGLLSILAISFLLLNIYNPRNLGDPAYLSWNINNED